MKNFWILSNRNKKAANNAAQTDKKKARFYKRAISLFSQEKMSFDDHVDQIGKAEDPTPTNDEEQYEHNDVQRRFRTKHNRQSYKDFHDPTYEGDEEKDNLQ